MNDRECVRCGAPAEWALIDDSGTMRGYICIECDHTLRRRRMGRRRRLTRWLRHRLGL